MVDKIPNENHLEGQSDRLGEEHMTTHQTRRSDRMERRLVDEEVNHWQADHRTVQRLVGTKVVVDSRDCLQ